MHYGLFRCSVFAEDNEVLGQRRYGIDALSVSCDIVIGDIYVEEVLPFSAYDGQGLYLGEVYLVEGKDRQNLRQRPFFVWQ